MSAYLKLAGLARGMILTATILTLSACGGEMVVSDAQFEAADQLADAVSANIGAAESLSLVSEIDHARLGAEAGTPMGPSRVFIFSDPELAADLFELNPLTALDMPLRVLVFAPADEGAPTAIANSFDYLQSRYALPAEASGDLRQRYENALGAALAGISQELVGSFANDVMQPPGITTIASPFDYSETIRRVVAAIDAQDDTMHFGAVDFGSPNAGEAAGHLLLFGAPGPGAKAMKNAQTLGLDGFCQRFLVWQDTSGQVFLSFNDLLALAERQGLGKSLPLRVIDYRLTSVFEDALTP